MPISGLRYLNYALVEVVRLADAAADPFRKLFDESDAEDHDEERGEDARVAAGDRDRRHLVVLHEVAHPFEEAEHVHVVVGRRLHEPADQRE